LCRTYIAGKPVTSRKLADVNQLAQKRVDDPLQKLEIYTVSKKWTTNSWQPH